MFLRKDFLLNSLTIYSFFLSLYWQCYYPYKVSPFMDLALSPQLVFKTKFDSSYNGVSLLTICLQVVCLHMAGPLMEPAVCFLSPTKGDLSTAVLEPKEVTDGARPQTTMMLKNSGDFAQVRET